MKVNGTDVKLSTSLILDDFLRQQGYEPSYIAVECNGEIVAKSNFETLKITDNDILEIVRFVGGG